MHELDRQREKYAGDLQQAAGGGDVEVPEVVSCIISFQPTQ